MERIPSGTRLTMKDGFKEVSRNEFRNRFKAAFDLDPDLTEDEFIELLIEAEFDVRRAQVKVLERVRKPGQFFVPVSATTSPIPSDFSQTLSPQNTPSFNSCLSTQTESPEISATPCPKPKPKQSAQGSGLQLDEESEEDPRPAKRRKIEPGMTSGRFNSRKSSSERKIRECSDDESIDDDALLVPLRKKANPIIGDSDDDSDDGPQLASSKHPPKPSPLRAKETGFDDSDSEFSDDQDDQDYDGDDGDYDIQSNEGSDPDRLNYSDSDCLTEDHVPNWGASGRKKGQMQMPSLRKTRKARCGDPNEAVLKHREATKVTPLLYQWAQPYYPRNMDEIKGVSGSQRPYLTNLQEWLEEAEQDTLTNARHVTEFDTQAIWHDSHDGGRIGYASVAIDGVFYQPGDCIKVHPDAGEITKRKRNMRCKQEEESDEDEGPRCPWFARIVYLYKEEITKRPMAHLRWFEHGSNDPHGEFASPQELFLLTQCDNYPCASIRGKVKVTREKGSKSTFEDQLKEQKYGNNEYFYQFHYNLITKVCEDATKYESPPRRHMEKGPICECCERKEAALRETRVLGSKSTPENRALHHRGDDYFVDDCVYIYTSSDKPYTIGQVIKFYTKAATQHLSWSKSECLVDEKDVKIKVRLFERYDTLHTKWSEEFNNNKHVHATRDERQLYLIKKTVKITSDMVEGKCHVRARSFFKDDAEFNDYKDEQDCFWVNKQVPKRVNGDVQKRDLKPLNSLEFSQRSESDRKHWNRRVKRFLEEGGKLSGMDIFSGSGGLAWGLERSGCVKTCHAVEFSEAACRTHKANFPHCIVHNADASIFLERAIHRERGEKLKPLFDHAGNLVPDLPRPSEIDFIYGGTPCPGFSRMNRYQTPDDIKNSLIFLYLAYLDFYRPKYALLENVETILNHRLGTTIVNGKLEGGVKQGTVKLIKRILAALGYQSEHAVLQAAEYEVPSTRPRAFFWASLFGFPLPAFPVPTNVFPSGKKAEARWYRRERRSGPHWPVTVGAAITDLKAFEWVNPHNVIQQSRSERLDREQRWNYINQYEVYPDDKFVGRDRQSYPTGPLSEYQRRLRVGVAEDALFNHVTQQWDKVGHTERVCNIPMRPKADHRDLPDILEPNFLSRSNPTAIKHRGYPGRVGRLDYESNFRACLTSMNPVGQNGTILHPSQHRVLSIREYARAMSYPDSFKFDLENTPIKHIIRQIGNSVPCNLAYALGLELRVVLIYLFEQKQEYEDRRPDENMESSDSFPSEKPSKIGAGFSQKVSVSSRHFATQPAGYFLSGKNLVSPRHSTTQHAGAPLSGKASVLPNRSTVHRAGSPRTGAEDSSSQKPSAPPKHYTPHHVGSSFQSKGNSSDDAIDLVDSDDE